MPRVDARGEPMLPVEDQEKDMSEQAVVRRAHAALRGYEEWRASHPLSSSVSLLITDAVPSLIILYDCFLVRLHA